MEDQEGEDVADGAASHDVNDGAGSTASDDDDSDDPSETSADGDEPPPIATLNALRMGLRRALIARGLTKPTDSDLLVLLLSPKHRNETATWLMHHKRDPVRFLDEALPARAAHDLPGASASVFAVAEDLRAVDENIAHAG